VTALAELDHSLARIRASAGTPRSGGDGDPTTAVNGALKVSLSFELGESRVDPLEQDGVALPASRRAPQDLYNLITLVS
jgi:hypothetical protein